MADVSQGDSEADDSDVEDDLCVRGSWSVYVPHTNIKNPRLTDRMMLSTASPRTELYCLSVGGGV